MRVSTEGFENILKKQLGRVPKEMEEKELVRLIRKNQQDSYREMNYLVREMKKSVNELIKIQKEKSAVRNTFGRNGR